MDKKTETTSFRCSTPTLDYIKQLADSDERSLSYIINKMISHFKDKGVTDARDIK